MYYKISDYGSLEKLTSVLSGLKQYIDFGEVFLAGVGEIYLNLKGVYHSGPYASDVDDFEDFLNSKYYGVKKFASKPSVSKRWTGNWEQIDTFIDRIK